MVSLTTNQLTYTPGQVVHMTFIETNNTRQSVFVSLGPSIDNFYITNNGRTIWRSNPRIAPLFIVHRELAPGQSITLKADWTASSAPGTYEVHNHLAPQAMTATLNIVENPSGPPGPSRSSFRSGTTAPTTGSSPPARSGASPLPANVSVLLDTIYEEYQSGDMPLPTPRPGQVEIQGSRVGIEIHDSSPGDFNTVVADAESLGLQVTDLSEAYDTVVGFLPIAQLPALAQLPTSSAVAPLLYPMAQ
jgi:hypothetical protein